MTENADLHSRVVELQSRHQVLKGSVLVYECPFVLQSVEREFQSLISVVQTKDRELAEANQQLRQKVNS